MIVVHLLLIALGILIIVAAIFHWDFWFYDAESVIIEWIGGETAVRWYWGIGGLMLIIATLIHWIWGKDLGIWW